MYRLFAALPIPRDISDQLVPLCRKVSGASWRPTENHHITLRFFGEMDGRLAEDLDHEISLIEAPQMELELTGTGHFGGNDPTALWAGVRDHPDLTRLAANCERAARRVGLNRDKRKFRPHITLAYCHGTPVSEAMAFHQRHAAFRAGPFWVDRFHLYSSHMGKGPSRYEAEADYPLGV